MSLPLSDSLESPILHELHVVGGTDDVRFLYERLVSYFPSLSDAEITAIRNGLQKSWKKAVQRAGKSLNESGLLSRKHGLWSLTEKGRKLVLAESEGIIFTNSKDEALSHRDIQRIIVDLAGILGFNAEIEYEFYDVVWRENVKTPRLSHVFEVQSKGNIDSAFAKLKRAYVAQRSKIFLIIDSERDANRAQKSLAQEFSELDGILTIMTFAQIRKLHGNLSSVSEILPYFIRA